MRPPDDRSKAGVLQHLDSVHTASFRVLPMLRFRTADWRHARSSVLGAIGAAGWSARPIAVRSSAAAEDRSGSSRAGHYTSVLDVRDRMGWAAAIDSVCMSMEHEHQHSPKDEFFVQPMLSDVSLAGVAFTAAPRNAAPYEVLEVSRDASTDTVTSGRHGATERWVRLAASDPDVAPAALRPIIQTLAELEDLLPDLVPLDVEIATRRDEVVVLQVRSLSPASTAAAGVDLKRPLSAASRSLTTTLGHRPTDRRRTVLSRMADWNPAEMIGTRPRPLATSLYRTLITDGVWATSRARYGFTRPARRALMTTVAGHPFIDVRRSLESFVPNTVDPGRGIDLVDCYLDRLRRNPELHDKLEFDIAPTGYGVDLPQQLAALRDEGVDARTLTQLERGLRACLALVLDPRGPWNADVHAGRCRLGDEPPGPTADPVTTTIALLDTCRTRGSEPFAGLARAAFMMTGLLHSLQRVSPPVFSADEFQAILGSAVTVATTMGHDLTTLDRPAWLTRYGHLRPGTYDIRSNRYDEAPDLYLPDSSPPANRSSARHTHQISAAARRRVENLLRHHELPLGADSLMYGFRRAVAARERGKFVMARHLSAVLRTLTRAGRELGLDVDALSFVTVDDIRRAAVLSRSGADVTGQLAAASARGRRNHAITEAVHLPDLLSRPDEVWCHVIRSARPAFVSRSTVVASPATDTTGDLAGRIVFLEAADPGFDHIFARGIAGFITKYGGPNSHMAVRANELALPAVVGAGALLFDQWRSARRLLLDCAAERVEILS